MTDILCNWLNDELNLSKTITNENFAESFSSGYLIGEILYRHGLLDDFDKLKDKNTSDAKLNNLIILEPTLKLIGVSFDNAIATDVIQAKTSVLVNLMYQLFIVLDRKKKSNLTATSLKTMQAAATKKYQEMETSLFQEKIKKVTPRQSDLNLEQVVNKYKEIKFNMQLKAERDRIVSAEAHENDTQKHRLNRIERSKYLQTKQDEQRLKIEAAVVKIPKPPPNKTLIAIERKKELRNQKEAEKSMRELNEFEIRKANEIGGGKLKGYDDVDDDELGMSMSMSETMTNDNSIDFRDHELTSTDLVRYTKLGNNNEYVSKIRARLESDKEARNAREKRRRKVLMNCAKSHFEQEEQNREKMMAMRLMQKSQMERRIAVQLIQVRNEKMKIIENRMYKEKQYQDRREKEFINDLDKNRELIRQMQMENADNLRAELELYNSKKEQYNLNKYKKHYEVAEKIISDIIDISLSYNQFNVLTEGDIPKKILSDWKTAFIYGVPIADKKPTTAVDSEKNEDKEFKITIQDVEVPVVTPYSEMTNRSDFEKKMEVLDEEDFNQYKQFIGEWTRENEATLTQNVILEWIVDRLAQLTAPVDDGSNLPLLPSFPIKAAIIGKCFSGKTSVVSNLVKNNKCVAIIPQIIINEALEAYENNEEVEIKVPIVPEIISEVVDSDPNKLDEDKTENLITDFNLNSSANDLPLTKTDDDANLTVPKDESVTAENQVEPSTEEAFETRMEPSKRALLGQRIKNELVNGGPVNDELLVEVLIEYIQRIPEDTGWILDDFPSTYQQAKLLEKMALGSGVTEAITPAASRASSKKKSTPTPPKDSIFDVIILLDTPDNDCLSRAMQCTEQNEKESEEEEGGEEGKKDTNASKDVIANLQTSLSKFSENWPKLFKFYSKIKDSLIKSVNSSQTNNLTSVYLEVESIFDQIVKRKMTPVVPEEPISLPVVEVEPQTEEILLVDDLSKTLEMESKEVHTSKGTSGKKSRKGSKGSKGSKSSSRASSAGSKSSKKSTSRKSRSKTKLDSQSGAAKKSSKKDSEREGSSQGSKSKKRQASAGSKGSKSSGRSSQSRSGSKKGKKTKTPTTEEKKEDQTTTISEAPEPMPGDPDWVYVEKPLDISISSAMFEFWDMFNQVYVKNCKIVFREIRLDKEDIIRYMYAVRSAFKQFLDRPDGKQEYIDQFQKEYNEMPNEWREDEEVMQDLHQQISELKAELLEISQESQMEAETELEKIKNNAWVEDKIGVLSNEYLNLLQHEFDRYQNIIRLLRDYYKHILGGLDEFKPEFLRLPVLQIPTEIEADPVQEEDPSVSAAAVASATDGGEGNKIPIASASKKGPSKTGKDGQNASAADESKDTVDDETEHLFQLDVPTVEYKSQMSQIMTVAISNVPTPAKAAKGDKGATVSLLKLLSSGKFEKKSEKSANADKESFSVPTDGDEKLIYDAAMCCITFINGILEYESSQCGQKEESDKPAGGAGAGDKGGKGDSKKGGGKGGKKSRTPTPKKGGSKDKTTTESEESEEDKQNRIQLEKAKAEYMTAIQMETAMTKAMVDHIMRKGIVTVRDLKSKVEQLFQTLSTWTGDKLTNEDTSIKEIEKVLRYHVETKTPIKEKIEIINNKFFLNPIEEPDQHLIPETVDEPIEIRADNEFSINSLKSFYNLFETTADTNTDFITVFDFVQVLTEIFGSLDTAGFPLYCRPRPTSPTPTTHANSEPAVVAGETSHRSQEQMFQSVVDAFSSDKEYVNWRLFMLACCMSGSAIDDDNNDIDTTTAEYNAGDSPEFDGGVATAKLWPTVEQLLQTLDRFKELDQRNVRFITREQYQFMDLWFTSQSASDEVNDDEMTTLQPNSADGNRLDEIKNLLFEIFKKTEPQELNDSEIDGNCKTTHYLDYENMLMHFAVFCNRNYYEGICKALSILVDQKIPVSLLAESDPLTMSADQQQTEEQNAMNKENDVNIPLIALYKIFTFGHKPDKLIKSIDLEDIQNERDALLMKSLRNIYESCGAEDSESASVPLSSLAKHDGLWEWLHTCCWFKYVSLKNLFSEHMERVNTPVAVE